MIAADYLPFQTYLQKFAHVTEEEFTQCLAPVITVREFDKKELLTSAGEVEDHFNFINKGLIRKYYRKKTHEINTQISMEGHIILSQESFYSRTPSEYYVEAIEPSTVISMRYDQLEEVFRQSQVMEHVGRLIVTHTLVLKDRWQLQMIKLTPRERFLQFIVKHADLVQRVPQKHLASYLNIKPETFSRFKHLLRNHDRYVVA